MPETRSVLERVMERVELRPFTLEGFHDRRDRKRRNQRIAAGVVGIAVFVAAVWIVTSGLSLDRSQTSVVPGGDVTGPAETRPTETGPAETGPTVTGVENPEPPPLVEPVQIGTVTRSGAGCALEIVAEQIPAGAGRLSVVNETNWRVSFELFRLDSEASFAQFEAFVEAFPAAGEIWPPVLPEGTTSGASVLVQREVGPGASGTITDNFTTGDAFAVVCLNRHYVDHLFGPYQYAPVALVGPIVVP